MLNGLGEYQKILLLGGKSDLALSILEQLPISEDGEIFLCGRNLSAHSFPTFLSNFQTHNVELDFTDVENSKQKLVQIFDDGDIDLVIIAYATLGNEELQLTPRLFQDVLNTNFMSQAILLNEMNTHLLRQLHGQILLISSVAGMRARRRNFVYGASKSGVDFIAQGLQKENEGKNVLITILRPGFVHTKMTENMNPAPFATDQLNVARIAASGLRKRKQVVYAPKILILIMFILKLLPERAFRFFDR